MITINLAPSVPASEFCEKFVQGMANRMGMSFFKYGLAAKAYPEKVDAIASLKIRLAKYEETGNTEYLLDVGNFAMIEYMLPRHPKAHFKAEDSAQSPGRAWTDGSTHAGANDPAKTTARAAASYYKRDGD